VLADATAVALLVSLLVWWLFAKVV
jgi:hypothetical protein